MSELDGWLETLGLERGATFGDIRAAYRDLAKVWHPDRFPNDERLRSRASEELKAINEAFANLERFRDAGGQLPLGSGDAPAGGAGVPVVRKRNPRRDTWTIRPPLQMRTVPATDRRRFRRLASLIVGVVFIGGVIAILIWRWPL